MHCFCPDWTSSFWSFDLYDFPQGHGSVSPVLHGDYPGGISGDAESALHIMIKVPVNLIREDSPLEMHQLNDAVICVVVPM